MTIAESLLPQFDHEMATTRKVLACVPEAKAAWKPHVKSMSLGDLAAHLATIAAWAVPTLRQPVLDFGSADGKRFAPPAFTTTAALLAARRARRSPRPVMPTSWPSGRSGMATPTSSRCRASR